MRFSGFVGLCLLGLCTAGWAAVQAPAKKLIEYGWDTPAPSYVARHIREMEREPFDGIIMHVPKLDDIFHAVPWQARDVQQELTALAQIRWERFTDNFIVMNVRSSMDWFSDADWQHIIANVALVARAAKLGHCTGVVFDPEAYGPRTPWDYRVQPARDAHNFTDYAVLARRRGAQFITAIQQEMPTPVIQTFFLNSILTNLADIGDAQRREEKLTTSKYGLLPAFLNGMLDAVGPHTLLIDGNEPSYYYTDRVQYDQAAQRIHQTDLSLVAPENRKKYTAQVQCAQAMYLDYLYNREITPSAAPISAYMTAHDQARWLEHNLYYALQSSDRYVWLYSQQMDWWKRKNLPDQMAALLRAAREKITRRQPLGDDIAGMIQQATAQLVMTRGQSK